MGEALGKMVDPFIGEVANCDLGKHTEKMYASPLSSFLLVGCLVYFINSKT